MSRSHAALHVAQADWHSTLRHFPSSTFTSQLGTHDPRLAPGMPGFLEMGVEGIQISPSGSGGARGGNSPRPSVSLHPSPGAGLLSEALRASPSPGPHPHAGECSDDKCMRASPRCIHGHSAL